MHVILYKTSSPPNKVKKTLSAKKELEGVIFYDEGSLNLVSPKIRLEYAEDASDLALYNYCYIPKLERYYYITNMQAEGSLVVVTCECDVLMSFQSDILNSTQYVLRSETLRSPYLVDNQIPIRSDKSYHQKVFGADVFNKSCPYVILETIGKGGTVV